MCHLPNWHSALRVRRFFLYNMKVIKGTESVTLPSYSAISFISKEAHKAALYDACLLIVNTYNQTKMLDDVTYNDMTSYEFMKFALNVLNQLAEDN